MEFRKRTIRDVNVAGKNVLVRVDYNVPMENGHVKDDKRIRASLPTIQYLLEHHAEHVILISHLGRPEGKPDPQYSLMGAAACLMDLLPDVSIGFVGANIGETVEKEIEKMPSESIILLENLRFDPGEESNDMEFALLLAESTNADLFVQDGFAVVHRAHASTDAIARVLPAVAGLLVEREVKTLESVMAAPEHPLLVIIGGAKVSDKQPMINRFLPIADMIAVGGKIASDGYTSDADTVYVAEDFTEDEFGHKLDIGSDSIRHILCMINQAKTVIWNGTLGKVEDPYYAMGSRVIAETLGYSQAKTIIGGGDTASFVEELQRRIPNLQYDLISTGGGASLALLSGKRLPGLEILFDK